MSTSASADRREPGARDGPLDARPARPPGSQAQGKHASSILAGAATGRVRRPGQRRQLSVLAFVLVVTATAVIVTAMIVLRQDGTYRLANYQASPVTRRTIVDGIQLGGTVRVRSESVVRAPTPGLLSAVLVGVGDGVAAGQVVARIDAKQLAEAVAQTEQQLASAERALQSLGLAWSQQLLSARQQRAALAAVVGDAEDALIVAEALFAAGSVSAAALADARGALGAASLAVTNHDESRGTAARLHELDVAGQEATILQLRTQLADLREQYAATDVRSPIAGRVIWTVDTVTTIGEPLAELAEIVRVADTRDPFVESSVEEQYVADLEIGQPVELTIGERSYPGTVERIGLLAQAPPEGGVPKVDLDIAVEAGGDEVLPGSTALASLVIGEVPDALVLPRGPFLVTGNRSYLYVVQDGTARRTTATFGAVTPEYVEVTSGVAEGAIVITSSYQDYVDLETIVLGGARD